MCCISDACVDCFIINGVGYKNHPTDCTKFIQCVFECTPVIYLPFDDDDDNIKDHSGNENYIYNDGVKVSGGAAYFDGKSSLRIPRFSNMDFGSHLMIKFKYYKGSPITRKQALISNGDCGVIGSLYILK
ncbi:protein PIF-like [Patella vulgata]|uniref:protein PIF-like n=1 Tax=Patella vulgata TaxID=6465 RepID=UPI0024A9F604|nr:protein PIF-like [Patella vulgata]